MPLTLPTVTRRRAATALCACALAYSAAGHAADAEEARAVGSFEAIALHGSIDLVVRQGPQTTLRVQADAKLLPRVETQIESGPHGATLQVRLRRDGAGWSGWGEGSPVRVSVVTPRLSAVSSAGAGDIRVEAFSTPALALSLSGSGDARLDQLSTEALEVNIAGAGDVSGSGKATRLQVSIAGSGDVALQQLQSDDVRITIAGSGDAAVQAQKTLDVRIAGSGDVTYAGNAALKSHIAGSGSVTRK
ncbi:MAG: DUF2807 domain-containing protein [Burkholderiales bacterium]|nr:DUF2807 domain-containing protein [Burkholderiales bacterium]